MRNNPVRYVDPSGHSVDCGIGESGCSPGTYRPQSSKPKQFTQPTPLNTPLPTPNPLRPVPIPTQFPRIVPDDGRYKPVQPSTDEFTAFWELDKLDAIGLRVDGSGWLPQFPFIGIDLNVDVVISLERTDVSIYFTPNLLLGVGGGASITGGVVGYYDAPKAIDPTGMGYGGQINITSGSGINMSYGYSDKPGSSGRHAQNWSIAASGGGQASGGFFQGITFLLINWGFGR
jgi:hypothetical protein